MRLQEALQRAAGEERPLLFVGPGATRLVGDGQQEWEQVHCPPETVLPVAAGAAAAGPGRPLVALAGDGDIYGAQAGDLIHLARRNPNLTVLVADNGLMTSREALTGPFEYPLRPIALALAAGATFVAQGWADDESELAHLVEEALVHPGFSLVNVVMRTGHLYERQRTRLAGEAGYHKHDLTAAQARVHEPGSFFTGILYHNPDRAAMPVLRSRGLPGPGEWQAAVQTT